MDSFSSFTEVPRPGPTARLSKKSSFEPPTSYVNPAVPDVSLLNSPHAGQFLPVLRQPVQGHLNIPKKTLPQPLSDSKPELREPSNSDIFNLLKIQSKELEALRQQVQQLSLAIALKPRSESRTVGVQTKSFPNLPFELPTVDEVSTPEEETTEQPRGYQCGLETFYGTLLDEVSSILEGSDHDQQALSSRSVLMSNLTKKYIPKERYIEIASTDIKNAMDRSANEISIGTLQYLDKYRITPLK